LHAYNYKSNTELDYNYETRNMQSETVTPIRHDRQHIPRHINRPKKKKRSLVSSLACLFAIATLGLCIFPFGTQTLKSMFFVTSRYPKVNKGTVSPLYKSFVYKSGVDIQSVMFPTLPYINNDLFLNQHLLAPALNNKKYAADLYTSAPMNDLTKQLKNLNAQYPQIKPAIYVWSFETGKYTAIDANKVYPAASIIKVPVLAQLFKSIESNQVSLYDTMNLTEYYRSPGSGEMQFSRAGNRYSIDDLAKVMIRDSDNTATNMLMSKVGSMDDVNTGIRSWGLKNTHVQTWLPDLTGTNTTTAADMAKILYNLENPSFLNINSREDIVKYMSKVKNNRLIQAGLPAGTPFVHKTGDIGNMLGDAGIVYLPSGQHYIVVILAQRPYNDIAGVNFIKSASSIIYNHMVNVK